MSKGTRCNGYNLNTYLGSVCRQTLIHTPNGIMPLHVSSVHALLKNNYVLRSLVEESAVLLDTNGMSVLGYVPPRPSDDGAVLSKKSKLGKSKTGNKPIEADAENRDKTWVLWKSVGDGIGTSCIASTTWWRDVQNSCHSVYSGLHKFQILWLAARKSYHPLFLLAEKGRFFWNQRNLRVAEPKFEY